MPAQPTTDPELSPDPGETPPTTESQEHPSVGRQRRRRGAQRRGARIALIVLSTLLALALGAGGWLLWQLDGATQQIEQQRRELDEQRDLIDKKEVFGAVMHRISDSITQLDGSPFATLVHWPHYDSVAVQGWAHRWYPDAIEYDIFGAERLADELEEVLANAALEGSSNATGTAWEETLDQLSAGFVTTVIEDAGFCGSEDALACVDMSDPFTVHVEAAASAEPHITDWIRTGVAYHEFAHVLQATNPKPTEETVAVFGGDIERMADCYSLTVLPGWTLEHKVWINSWSWWDVEVGYGYTCNEPERQAIRDWIAKLGVTARPISN